MTPRPNTTKPKQAVKDWEDEGGAIITEPGTPLPKGVERVLSTRYRVGPYTYDRLSDAAAESRRLWPRDA